MAVEEMTALPDAAAQSVGAQAHKKALGRRIYEGRVAYVMIAPTFVFLLVFMYYPAVLGLYRSVFKWTPGIDAKFVGLGNFIQLFTKDRVFLSSMDHMLQLAAWYVVSTVGVSLFIAILIHRLRGNRTQYSFRLGMILPVVIPGIVPLMLWKFIYDIKVGPLNAILTWVGLESWTRAWLSDPNVALYAVMLRNFPWVDGRGGDIDIAGGLAGHPLRDRRERHDRRGLRDAALLVDRVAADRGADQADFSADDYVGCAGVYRGVCDDAGRAYKQYDGAGNVDVLECFPHQ